MESTSLGRQKINVLIDESIREEVIIGDSVCLRVIVELIIDNIAVCESLFVSEY